MYIEYLILLYTKETFSKGNKLKFCWLSMFLKANIMSNACAKWLWYEWIYSGKHIWTRPKEVKYELKSSDSERLKAHYLYFQRVINGLMLQFSGCKQKALFFSIRMSNFTQCQDYSGLVWAFYFLHVTNLQIFCINFPPESKNLEDIRIHHT